MKRNIYLYLEFSDGSLSGASAELVAVARRLFADDTLTALVGQAQPEEVAGLPVDGVYAGGANYPLFPDVSAHAAADLPPPDLLLASTSADGRAFAAAYAALTKLPLTGNVVEIEPIINSLGEECVRVKRGAAANRALESAELPYAQILLLQPGVWGDTCLPPAEGKPRIMPLPLPEYMPPAQLEQVYTASRQEMELEEAAVVVSGGAGLQTAKNFRRLDELGELLNAPVGGSRVAEDKSWIEHRQMIGATGVTIAPRLYLCLGVSGAVQHSVGIRGSASIIAVNTDATAAIFNEADLAVEGDAIAVIEALLPMLAVYKPAEGGMPHE